MNETQCKELMERVRTFFKKGNKFTNKRYYPQLALDNKYDPVKDEAKWQELATKNDQTELNRAVRRWTRADQAMEHRLKKEIREDPYYLAQMLITMPITNRSGNCLEMAALSAYFAHKHHNLPREGPDTPVNTGFLYIGNMPPRGFIPGEGFHPADHAFCLITSHKVAKLTFPTVKAFTTVGGSGDWWVIDPWLHVVCRAKEYLQEANKKLSTWDAKGKRIRWAGSQGDGWYPPGGEYTDQLGVTPMELMPF